jgi:uncharacterized protein YcbK (DUF882 family)
MFILWITCLHIKEKAVEKKSPPCYAAHTFIQDNNSPSGLGVFSGKGLFETMVKHDKHTCLPHLPVSRRQVLKIGLAAVAATCIPWPGLAATMTRRVPERTLSLHNTHTGESVHNLAYWAENRYRTGALQQINHLLRDHRNNQVTTMDPQLLDLLSDLHERLESSVPFEIISGYRSPETNRWLRNHSNGVAKNSLHMAGRAIDIRLPGCHLKTLRRTAIALNKGGVGYYPRSNFVHIDTGRPRFW